MANNTLFGVKIKSNPGHSKREEMFKAFNDLRNQKPLSSVKSDIKRLRSITEQDLNVRVR